jgi:signal transduction histidine kinase
MSDSSRVEIARELHDGIAQELVALGYRIELLMGSAPIHAVELLPLRLHILTLTERIRDEVFGLRTYQAFSHELDAALIDFREKYTVTVDIQVQPSAYQSDLLSDIARELIKNADLHAGASRIAISLTRDSELLHFQVRDDGKGGLYETDGRYGLTGIAERAHLLQGEFSIKSDDGTVACVSFPIAPSLS